MKKSRGTSLKLLSKWSKGTSLVAQWLRIRLSMQGTWVRSLAWEDPTCHGATKPASHNYWARVPHLLSPRATTAEARTPRAHALQQEKPLQWEARTLQWRVAPLSPQLEKARVQQGRPSAAPSPQKMMFKDEYKKTQLKRLEVLSYLCGAGGGKGRERARL